MKKVLFLLLTLSFSFSGFAAPAKKQCQKVFSKAEEAYQAQMDRDQPDRFEASRYWGTKFLSENDPTWKDPKYLARIQEFLTPEITNYGGKAAKLFEEYQYYFNKFFPGEIRHITMTGTDANNFFFEYAAEHYRRKFGKSPTKLQMLTFRDIYGGSHGQIGLLARQSEINFHTGPYIHPNKNLTESEIAAVMELENKILKDFEKKMASPRQQVGGIFLEAIPAAHGVFKFRTEFLLKLRKLADQYDIPIFCDEILTGGGRTGKFWAFQHYVDPSTEEAFVPDLVSFGKGFGLSGIFQPYRRGKWWLSIQHGPSTTTDANPLALIQSLQIVKTIWERRLDLQAAETGEAILKKTIEAIKRSKQIQTSEKEYFESGLSGVGLLITGFPYASSISKEARSNQSSELFNPGYNARITPILTTTVKDVDWLLTKLLKWDY